LFTITDVQSRKNNYEVSGLAKDYVADKIVDPTIRSSKSAVLPEDSLVSCIERRSLDFQGFLPTSQIENLQTVKYETGDLFRSHYDWLNGVGADGKDNPRLSTIFAYVEADKVIGGSTQFPRIKSKFPEAWCKFIDCDSEIAKEAEGVGFKPIVGNAVLFMQYYANGTGHPDVLHQGMPVKSGTKIGMNIMTRQFPGYSHDF
jgi:prolyl 4-hydroxylase